MKITKRLLAAAGSLVLFGCAAGRVFAQNPNGGPGPGGGFGGGGFGGPGGGFGGPGGGGFDPAQMQQMVENMRQQMLDAQRQQLEVTNDDEWKVIAAQIQKVTDARAQANTGGGGGMFGMFGGRRGGRGGGFAGGFGGPGGGPGGPGGGFAQIAGMPNMQPDPAAESLQRAIDANASSDELKAGIAKLLDSRKQKQDALLKAEADLRKLLSVRQEAIAYTMGLL